MSFLREQRTTALTVLSVLIDILAAVAAFVLAYNWKSSLPGEELSSLAPLDSYAWFFATYLFLLLIANYLNGMYTFGRTLTYGELLSKTARSIGIVALAIITVMFLFKIQTLSRLLFSLFVLFNLVVAAILKCSMKLVTGRMQTLGYNPINALVVGSGPMAVSMIENLRERPELGYHIVGCVDADPERVGQTVIGVPVIGSTEDFAEILSRDQVDEVFFAMPFHLVKELPKLIWLCEEIGIRFSLMADVIQTSIAKAHLRYFLDVPLLTFSSTPSALGQLFIKGLMDRTLAGLGLLVLSPLFVVVATLIKITSRGPVFFKQVRCGLNGRLFTMFKFRTMVENAEQLREELMRYNEMTGPVFKMKGDPRITPIGRWLRKYSLDELPQLMNVFKGEMSLVGPRPPIPEEVQQYKRWQRRRLSMRPGLTCFWQIAGRNEVNFDEWMRLDLKYIDNWSLKLDFIILGKTIPVVLLGKGAS
ncbi:MAG: sugar transferase [Deltaproteobacteria bacterium]|nr:sugar transferase [Deltaproteobacteria bacterium]MCB9479631.1 sugar transferase [Deltaproteobacteria bacterium]MCB9489872.1 sugar transferase [Deltaproteobacteria bacterium]